jgi:hypothetical protein
MRKAGLYDQAAAAAERVIREHGVSTLLVDPMAIARNVGIEVKEKPASSGGVSGVLVRLGMSFASPMPPTSGAPGSGGSASPTSLGTISLKAILKRFSLTAPCTNPAQGSCPTSSMSLRRITSPRGCLCRTRCSMLRFERRRRPCRS